MLHLHLPQYKQIEVLSKNIPGSISFSQGAVKVGGTPREIKQHISQLLESDCLDYYQPVGGIVSLREKIVQQLTKRFNISLEVENLIISHGSIGGITALCLTLLKEGEEVILPSPAYPSYQNIIKFSKANPIFVPCMVNDAHGWSFDMDQIKRSTNDKTKMIILSNPSNPTGYCLSHEELVELFNWCVSHKIYLVFDEVYDNFIFEGEFCSGTPFVLQSEYAIRTGSFSKDFSMSGWRVGYIVASKNLVTNLTAVQDGTLCCPNVIGQHAALFALDNRQLIEQQKVLVRQSKEIASRYLEPLCNQGIFSYHNPPAGIFLFLKTQLKDTLPLVNEILTEAKVALVPGIDFGPDYGSYVRLCFAREPAVVEEGMKRIQDFFKKNS